MFEEYRKYQVSNENNLLEQGDGFNLVTKLLNINNFSKNEKIVEVFYYPEILQILGLEF